MYCNIIFNFIALFPLISVYPFTLRIIDIYMTDILF